MKSDSDQQQQQPKFAFVYLHGLLSSGRARKACELRELLMSSSFGPLDSPTLFETPHDFSTFTTTNLFPKVTSSIHSALSSSSSSSCGGRGCGCCCGVVLIGSSFGGLLACRFVQTHQPGSEHVVGVVLLAPALELSVYIRETPCLVRIINGCEIIKTTTAGEEEREVKKKVVKREERESEEVVKEWKESGWVELRNKAMWGEEEAVMWSWSWMKDMEENHEKQVSEEEIGVPVLMIQGEEDEIVPCERNKEWIMKMKLKLKIKNKNKMEEKEEEKKEEEKEKEKDEMMMKGVFLKGGNHVLDNVDIFTPILKWLPFIS